MARASFRRFLILKRSSHQRHWHCLRWRHSMCKFSCILYWSGTTLLWRSWFFYHIWAWARWALSLRPSLTWWSGEPIPSRLVWAASRSCSRCKSCTVAFHRLRRCVKVTSQYTRHNCIGQHFILLTARSSCTPKISITCRVQYCTGTVSWLKQ